MKDLIQQLIDKEISYIDFKKFVFDNNDFRLALNFYRIFGHNGIFDELFINSEIDYMLRFPQIYFSKANTGIEVFEEMNKFSSKVYSEPISEMFMNEFKTISSGTKIFINKDGNFVVRSSDFEYVANFNGKLYRPNKEFFKKVNK